MPWSTPSTAIAGSVLTAAFWNTQVKDNLLELRGGGVAIAGQVAGDALYAASATQFGRRERAESDMADWLLASGGL